jgi:hypothetical protein
MSENVFDVFNETTAAPAVETPAAAPADEAAQKKAASKAANKAKLAAMQESLKKTIAEDPTFQNRLRSLSASIEVVNSLGFGDTGGLVVDKAATQAIGDPSKRVLAPTSQIFGYRVKNIGETAIPYTTEVYTKDETGKFVGKVVDRTLAPGATADLARQYMTRMAAVPEISFQLANGKMIRGSSANKASLKDELEAYYFSFDKDLGKNVNSDEVKLNMAADDKVDGHWVTRPEFEESFGFLNNLPEKKERTRKAAGQKYTATDMAANYVNSLIKEAAL